MQSCIVAWQWIEVCRDHAPLLAQLNDIVGSVIMTTETSTNT